MRASLTGFVDPVVKVLVHMQYRLWYRLISGSMHGTGALACSHETHAMQYGTDIWRSGTVLPFMTTTIPHQGRGFPMRENEREGEGRWGVPDMPLTKMQ